jgi:hypothetical protein
MSHLFFRHGSNTKDAPKSLRGLAAPASQGEKIVTGGSVQAMRCSPHNFDVLGTKRKHFWSKTHFETGKNLRCFRAKAAAR